MLLFFIGGEKGKDKHTLKGIYPHFYVSTSIAMIRRVSCGALQRVPSSSIASRVGSLSSLPFSASHALQLHTRSFHSMLGILGSCAMCGASMLCFGSWANNYCNIKKYGRWRFRNTVDDVIMVEDFPQARYIGAFIGFLFWWFVVGPQKYRWASNLEEVPGNVRIGPF